ncbi:hypothetical protein PVK06_029910 [Gossypium arboreum]|uniref:Heparanase-like protein 2 n=1 Tax=Gossypium arboreum TaxID=29729 RepID=A0ABR0NLU6_GOSAR|nr:hypothetical protein PVK06_029910 [Gossypium arboreum]
MDLKCIFNVAILVSQISLSLAQNVNVVIQEAKSITEKDDNFVCASLDWWPIEKCNYNQCPWRKAGLLNLERLRERVGLNLVQSWYFDQLGMALAYNHKVFCRQTLFSGNYALLNTTTSIPDPDYYGSVSSQHNSSY